MRISWQRSPHSIHFPTVANSKENNRVRLRKAPLFVENFLVILFRLIENTHLVPRGGKNTKKKPLKIANTEF